MKERIGFIGLGRMGSAIANNLVDSGFAVAVYNRTPERAQPFAGMGAAVARRPADAVVAGGIAITMVSDDRALEEVVASDGFLQKLSGGVHVSMSTVSPALARRLARRHEEAGSAYVAAPVFGRPDAAAARKLWICVSGPSRALERVRPMIGDAFRVRDVARHPTHVLEPEPEPGLDLQPQARADAGSGHRRLAEGEGIRGAVEA